MAVDPDIHCRPEAVDELWVGLSAVTTSGEYMKSSLYKQAAVFTSLWHGWKHPASNHKNVVCFMYPGD